MHRVALLAPLLAVGCYFRKPSDPDEGGLDDQVASGPDGRHHADGVPAREGQLPTSFDRPAPQQATVTVSGSVRYDGQAEGSMRVDVHRMASSDAAPSMLGSTAAEADGSWALEVPEHAGRILLCAYLDRDDNGPSWGEPKVVLPSAAVVQQAPIAGLALELLEAWDERHPDSLTGLHLAPAVIGPPPHPSGQGSP
jgi:hypothetical protein